MLDDYDDREDAPSALDWFAAMAAWFVKLSLVCALLTACAWYWIWLGRGIVSVFGE